MLLWELRDIKKSFYNTQALKGVSLKLETGQIHALLGENGSGKSTLMKCLAGVHRPDSGEILHEGQPVTLHNPKDARAQGVATIFQEFSLVSTLSVAENIFLGRQPRMASGGVDWKRMRRETISVLNQLDIRLDPDATVKSLSVAEQQLIEIAKAISLDSSLLIMDEPTAALGLAETERLLALMRRLAAAGKAIVYISHRLDEVFEVADIITVLKDGNLITTRPISAITQSETVKLMVGVDIEQHYPKIAQVTPDPVLTVRGLSTDNGVHDVSFTIHRGEVFGLGGMVGSGRTEIARALFGVDRPTGGEIMLNGRAVRFANPVQAIAGGIGMIPENRKSDGLFFNFEAPRNITISRLQALLSGVFLNPAKEVNIARGYVRKLSVTPTAMEKSVKFLSGGNQQKVVIARWLFSQAQVLILDEPTQGIDVGAKLDVYNVINELTAQGISVLLISSDYPELLAMSDTIAIVRDGRILHTAPASSLTQVQLLAIASGVQTDAA